VRDRAVPVRRYGPVYVAEVGVADGAVVIRDLAHWRLASILALQYGNDIGRDAVVPWLSAAGVLSGTAAR